MAFDLENLKKIIAVAKESGLTEIEVSEGDCTYRCVMQPTQTSAPVSSLASPIVKQVNQEVEQPVIQASSTDHAILAPMVGTVYLAPAPDAEPYVIEGKHVKKGDVVCLIEAMKMFNKVKAERDGIVRTLRIKDGSSVEFEQVLFELEEA